MREINMQAHIVTKIRPDVAAAILMVCQWNDAVSVPHMQPSTAAVHQVWPPYSTTKRMPCAL